jgi:undecaprenyl diphosphate synthase
MKIVKHVAIIPDANRRWAQKKGLKPWQGHEEGAKNLEKIVEEANELGVKYLTFWGSSIDNLKKRPLREKKALLDIYKRYFEKLITSKRVHKNKIKINVIGDWENHFPKTLKKVIFKVQAKTKNYNKFFLTFLLAYSGDLEMIRAIRKIALDFKKGLLTKINKAIIKEYLYTKDLPEVDLLIRSGSLDDPHLSAGFMMWDLQNTQLFFSKKAWPEFSKSDFRKAVTKYKQVDRRFGK